VLDVELVFVFVFVFVGPIANVIVAVIDRGSSPVRSVRRRPRPSP
jgi:hypothetical protein